MTIKMKTEDEGRRLQWKMENESVKLQDAKNGLPQQSIFTYFYKHDGSFNPVRVRGRCPRRNCRRCRERRATYIQVRPEVDCCPALCCFRWERWYPVRCCCCPTESWYRDDRDSSGSAWRRRNRPCCLLRPSEEPCRSVLTWGSRYPAAARWLHIRSRAHDCCRPP